MALNPSFSNRGCNRVFNASTKDAVMRLTSLQFTFMQKLLFGFSATAARVWRSGTISSSSTESCSKIPLAVLYHHDEKHHSHLCLGDEEASSKR